MPNAGHRCLTQHVQQPQDLAAHECLRLKQPNGRTRIWHLWQPQQSEQVAEVAIEPVLQANHTDTLLRATLDGAGITGTTVELAAPHLASGALVPVLQHCLPTPRDVHLVYAPDRRQLPKLARFVEFVVGALGTA